MGFSNNLLSFSFQRFIEKNVHKFLATRAVKANLYTILFFIQNCTGRILRTHEKGLMLCTHRPEARFLNSEELSRPHFLPAAARAGEELIRHNSSAPWTVQKSHLSSSCNYLFLILIISSFLSSSIFLAAILPWGWQEKVTKNKGIKMRLIRDMYLNELPNIKKCITPPSRR